MLNAFLFFVSCMNNVLDFILLCLLNAHVFMAGAKVEYLFYLLQAKTQKTIADYKSLTLIVIEDLFLQDICSSVFACIFTVNLVFRISRLLPYFPGF
jgi:hypothetical protein